MDRNDFLQELKLRRFIKESIRLHRHKEKEAQLKIFFEEEKIRTVVRKLINESEEDRPHHSTGINVLSDLLKKIVPVIEIDYKKMTSNPTQRQSFRAHILKASQNTIATEQVGDSSESGEENQEAMMHEDSPEAAINLDVGEPKPEDKFIDIERPSKKNAKVKQDPVDAFKIEGEDETGRNIALTCFQKIEKSITESYSILSDQEDKRMFYDYLITNLKLYFDRFEDELSNNTEEPSSPADQANNI